MPLFSFSLFFFFSLPFFFLLLETRRRNEKLLSSLYVQLTFCKNWLMLKLMSSTNSRKEKEGRPCRLKTAINMDYTYLTICYISINKAALMKPVTAQAIISLSIILRQINITFIYYRLLLGVGFQLLSIPTLSICQTLFFFFLFFSFSFFFFYLRSVWISWHRWARKSFLHRATI